MARVVALAGWAAIACSDPGRDRLRETTTATYDPATGRLKELTFDANANGRIDTWSEMDGSRPVRARIDSNEDGRIDRWEYYDEQGRLRKVGFSRADDGVPDGWAYSSADGRVERTELSSARDEKKIDRWERYAPAGASSDRVLQSVEEDGNGDGRPDKWESYDAGALKTVAFDENHDGTPDRRLTYDGGSLVLIETEPDGRGGYRKQLPVR